MSDIKDLDKTASAITAINAHEFLNLNSLSVDDDGVIYYDPDRDLNEQGLVDKHVPSYNKPKPEFKADLVAAILHLSANPELATHRPLRRRLKAFKKVLKELTE